jgi:hypothetical protein
VRDEQVTVTLSMNQREGRVDGPDIIVESDSSESSSDQDSIVGTIERLSSRINQDTI